MDASSEFAMTGTVASETGGVLISVDGGRDWVVAKWPAEVSAWTVARYGAFPSPKVWYTTGGNWPSNNSLFHHGPDCYSLSHKSCIRVGAQHRALVARAEAFRQGTFGLWINHPPPDTTSLTFGFYVLRYRTERRVGDYNGYIAVILKTTDAGATYEPIRVYMQHIQFNVVCRYV